MTAAAAEMLAARTGAWDMTTVVHFDGPLLSPEMLARLPPQARAQIEASLAGNLTKPHHHRTCLTQEQLERGFHFGEGRGGQCAEQVVHASSSQIEMTGLCHERDGDMTLHAVISMDGPTSMAGHFELNRAAGEGPKHVTGEVTGTWAAAACTTDDDRGK